MQWRYEKVLDFTAWLIMKQGMYIYSPIVHSHHISEKYDDPARGLYDWMPLDKAMLLQADSLIIFQIDGCDTSVGVREEAYYARDLNKTIIYSKEAWSGYDHTTLNKSF